MPFKGLPKCQACERAGRYSANYTVKHSTDTYVVLSCNQCGSETRSKSARARQLARSLNEKQRLPITRESIPEGEWLQFRKIATTKMLRMQGPFAAHAREGLVVCEDGWLAVDSEGWPYAIAAAEHARTYRACPEATDTYVIADQIKEEAYSKHLPLAMVAGRMVAEARQELARVLSGDLTDEELQEFCHNLSEEDLKKHTLGCLDYRNRLIDAMRKADKSRDAK